MSETTITTDADMNREARLRRLAKKAGLYLMKDRARTWSIDNQGGWMIIDVHRNYVMCGEHFNLTLDDVEAYLAEEEA